MEIINENKVSYPTLASRPSAKEKLGAEVACRIIDLMNRNEPQEIPLSKIRVRHHGDQFTERDVFITDCVAGKVGFDRYWKSGDKVAEAVIGILNRVSKIDSVEIFIDVSVCIGKFTM